MRPLISFFTFVLLLVFYTLLAKTDTTYYENGNVKTIQNLNKNGEREGKLFNFYETGQKALETNYKNNKANGYLIAWWKNGKIQRKTHFEDDKIEGWKTNWDSLGFPTDSLFYENGKKKERFLFYFGTRQVRIHQYYVWKENKKLVTMEDVYSRDGKIISQVRNGNGISHDISSKNKYHGINVYKNGVSDFQDYIGLKSGDPRLKRKPMPKSKLLPWNVEKYGSVK
jgi:antitoxin component YwqK of YwqJK toxin-antitoxin module